MTDHIVIGLHGFAGAGKDAVADHLVFTHGYVRYALADAVRAAVLALDPYIDDWGLRLSARVNENGWDVAKRNSSEVRRLLQVMGTEVGRKMFGEDVWVDRFADWLKAQPAGTKVVVTDVRFPNEAQRIDLLGGTLWHVVRPGVGPVNDHASEHGLPVAPWHWVLRNGGTLDDLANSVDALLAFGAARPTIEPVEVFGVE